MSDSCCNLPAAQTGLPAAESRPFAEIDGCGCELPAAPAQNPAGLDLGLPLSLDLPVLGERPAVRPLPACPICGQKGRPVAGQTVKALLKVSLRLLSPGDYLFCKTPGCPVVYYPFDGGQAFTVDQVREPVYQKQPDRPDVPVCYCFAHPVGELQAASPHERQTIVDDITLGTQTGQCACDLRNPQGACCLGNVRALVKRLDAAEAAASKLATVELPYEPGVE